MVKSEFKSVYTLNYKSTLLPDKEEKGEVLKDALETTQEAFH